MDIKKLYEEFPLLWQIRKSIRFYRGQIPRLKRLKKEMILKFYNIDTHNKSVPISSKKCIMMIDGRFPHGGLTDRLRGCLSVYSYCKQHKIPFYIHFIYPFNLKDCLVPNVYDWAIASTDIDYEYPQSTPVVLDCFDAILEGLFDKLLLNRFVLRGISSNYHIYSNAHFHKKSYSELFHELFKPANELQLLIDENIKNLGSRYYAATFRFQQLLGDFKEGNIEFYHILNDTDKNKLIEKCKEKLMELLEALPQNYRLLVTSDSSTFLEEVSKISRIYVIPGKVVHMNYEQSDVKVFLKSFIDLYLLMGAEAVNLFQTGKMYNSGFPKFAAKLGNTTFNHIRF
jgi:hypothetical protein